MKSAPVLKTYTKKERNLYLTGLAGQNIIYNIIGGTLSYYLQFTILIPAMAVSYIMAFARVWDAVNDPVMGTLVDRTRTKWGKCRPFLIFSPIPIYIFTVACFTNFGFFDPHAQHLYAGKNLLIVAWALLSYLIWEMAYTAGDIPLWGITALMTEDQKQRAKLLSLARIFGGIGGGIAILSIQSVALALGKAFAPMMGGAPQGERMGFIMAAVIYGGVATAAYQMVGIFTKEKIAASPEKHTMKENFALMWTNKPFRQVLLSGILGSPKQLIALAAMPLVSYYYANKDPKLTIQYIALLGGCLMIGQFLAMGFTPRLLTRLSKKDAYNYSNLLSAAPYAVVFFLYKFFPDNLTEPLFLGISALLFFVNGAFQGVASVIQSLMIADAVDYEEYKNGIRPDGVFFAGQTFIAKITTGIATIISGIAYKTVGFSDKVVEEVNKFIADGHVARTEPKYASYMMILFFLVSIPPMIGCLVSVIPTWRYSLSDEEHTRILDELNRRRHEKDEQTIREPAAVAENNE